MASPVSTAGPPVRRCAPGCRRGWPTRSRSPPRRPLLRLSRRLSRDARCVGHGGQREGDPAPRAHPPLARAPKGGSGGRPQLGPAVPILGPVERSPLKRYDASPAELQERLAAERSGSAFLVFRDAAGLQRLVPLDQEADAVTLGRGSACAIRITWDNEVSRVHAELARVGHEWTIADMGLSRNGTFVNGQHLGGKHLLADGDVIRIGRTLIGYRSTGSDDDATVTAGGSSSVPELSPAQRAVLVELCRPLLAEGGVT